MDHRPERGWEVTRRQYVLASLLTVMTGVAGCLGGGGDSQDNSTETESSDLEILHRWTRGADGEAMSALLDEFESTHPEIPVVEDTLPARANENMKTAIRTRMVQENNPPSTWQTWPGKNLVEFLNEDLVGDFLGDIEADVWEPTDMKDAYLEGPQRAAQLDGAYVSVPVNIHRLNAVFYNVEVLEQAGVEPQTLESVSAFMAALEKIAADTDAVPLAHSTLENWTTLQLWATLLLSIGGYDQYQTFTDGDPNEVEPAITEACETVRQLKEYIPDDAASIEWPTAAQRLKNGEAGLFHQGDWAAGVFLDAEDSSYGEDWDWIPFPGTEGLYSIGMDGFTYPEPNPSPEATKTFLRFVGSASAQETFNAIKGSIPPRTDIATEQFSEYQTDQIENFRTSGAQPNTIAHGLAVTPKELDELRQAVGRFTENWDVESAVDAFVAAVS